MGCSLRKEIGSAPPAAEYENAGLVGSQKESRGERRDVGDPSSTATTTTTTTTEDESVVVEREIYHDAQELEDPKNVGNKTGNAWLHGRSEWGGVLREPWYDCQRWWHLH